MRRKVTPLAIFGNLRSLFENFDDRLAIFQLHGHKDSGHQGKVEGHVKFVAVAEIGAHVRRPLIRFSQEHSAGKRLIQALAQFADYGVGFGQIFAVGTVALDEVRHRIQPESVHAHLQPELA